MIKNIKDMDKRPIDYIADCVDTKRSFCFNSGAGSGKTYNLVKTIEYISEKYGKSLIDANQKIMVITYTNAATNEIIKRIGKSRICDISTIHTRLWDIIKRFQSDLMKLHLQKINDEIAKAEETIKDNPYRLDEVLKKEIDTNKSFIEEFYKYSSLAAFEYKQKFSRYTTSGQIPNVNVFKTFVSKINKQIKLERAKYGIEMKLRGYKKVEYDPFDNTDKLHKMKFSHDTLIEYASSIIESNKTIRKIIADKYPYILIDEYQDTSEKVVKSFGQFISETMVGFYGDNCQNIYEGGVGNRLFDILPTIYIINNDTNRRSASEIVKLGNRIRNDKDFNQIPYSSEKGSVQVFYSKLEDDQVIDSFISKVSNEFSNSKVSFFLLKNEQIANKNGFGTFYSILCNTTFYKNNHDQVTTETLSDDETKLGKVPHNLFQILRLKSTVLNCKKPISEYIPATVYGGMNMNKLLDLVTRFKRACTCNNVEELISNLSYLYNNDLDAKTVLEKNVSDCVFASTDDYRSYLFDNLYGSIPEEKEDEAQVAITSLLATSVSEITNWYNYILRIGDKPISFYTFHGTKGLEFENVGVIITNNFYRKNDYFHSFFKDLNSEQKSDGFDQKKNLLYVSVTRAKKNLRVLYLDSGFNSIKDSFSSVFGESEEYAP